MPKNALLSHQFDALTPLMSALLQEEALTSHKLAQVVQSRYGITAAQSKRLTSQWLSKANAQGIVSPKDAYGSKSVLWTLSERKSILRKTADQILLIVGLLGLTFKDLALTGISELSQAFALAPDAMTGFVLAAFVLIALTRSAIINITRGRRQRLVRRLAKI